MAEADFNTFVQDVAKGKPEARLQLAKQLKQAGLWTGKVTDKFNANYYNALLKLDAAQKQQALVDKITGAKTPDRYSILVNLIGEGGAGDGSGPTTRRETYITSASQTAKVLDQVAEDLLGRRLTKAEKAKYTKLINQEQKAQPSVTTYGTGYTTTKGGVDEEEFITEQLSGTKEAQTKKATDAYTVLMEELGGLR